MDFKIPKKLVDIENADKKGWHERWTENRSKDIANIPHASRICLIGGQNSGKSFICKHLLLHQRPHFKEVYIIHGDSDCTSEYADIEPTMMLAEIPDVSFFDGGVKSLCILDDVEYSNMSKDQMARLNKLIRYISSHKNLSVYITHQSFFDLPTLVRKLCNVFVIWKPRSRTELKLIYGRIGLEPDQLLEIFDNQCSGYRDSLMVDFTKDSPAMFRKNIWEKLDIKSKFF